MSIPSQPEAAKLVIGIYTNNKTIFSDIAETLCDEFGLTDIISPWMNFDYTSYYEAEMGKSLIRRMLSFENLIEQEDLAKIKLMTNKIEKKYSKEGKRTINIDPGYMLLSRFVLATGKDFTHRIYIGKGIYADLTLIFKNGGFQTLPWTYPDYADNTMISYLTSVRNKYINDKKNKGTDK